MKNIYSFIEILDEDWIDTIIQVRRYPGFQLTHCGLVTAYVNSDVVLD